MKKFLDDSEYPVVIKFLSFLIKDQILKENIGDVVRALDIEDTKEFGSKIGKALTRDELKILTAMLDDEEKKKKFMAVIQKDKEPPAEEEADLKDIQATFATLCRPFDAELATQIIAMPAE